MSYIIHYVADSSPGLIELKSKKDAEDFIQEFAKLGRFEDGYWVDFVIKGTLLWASGHYEGKRNDTKRHRKKAKKSRVST